MNFVDLNIEIFCDFQVFLFWALYSETKTRKSWKFIKNPKILKYENVIFQELLKLFKWDSQNNSATLLIMCHIFVFLDLLTSVCFFVVYFRFNAQKVEIVIDWKTDLHAFELYRSKNKNFLWFPGFRFELYTQKRKLGNHGNPTKTP